MVYKALSVFDSLQFCMHWFISGWEKSWPLIQKCRTQPFLSSWEHSQNYSGVHRQGKERVQLFTLTVLDCKRLVAFKEKWLSYLRLSPCGRHLKDFTEKNGSEIKGALLPYCHRDWVVQTGWQGNLGKASPPKEPFFPHPSVQMCGLTRDVFQFVSVFMEMFFRNV